MSADREICGVEMPEPADHQICILGNRWTHCSAHLYDAKNSSTRALFTADQLRETLAAAVALKNAEIVTLRNNHASLKKMVNDGSANGRLYDVALEQEKEIVALRAEVKLKDAQNASLMKALQDCASTCNGMHGGPSVPCSRDIARNAIAKFAKFEAAIRARSQA